AESMRTTPPRSAFTSVSVSSRWRGCARWATSSGAGSISFSCSGASETQVKWCDVPLAAARHSGADPHQHRGVAAAAAAPDSDGGAVRALAAPQRSVRAVAAHYLRVPARAVGARRLGTPLLQHVRALHVRQRARAALGGPALRDLLPPVRARRGADAARGAGLRRLRRLRGAGHRRLGWGFRGAARLRLVLSAPEAHRRADTDPRARVAVGDRVCAARAALRRDGRAAGRGPLRAPGRDARRGAVHPLLALAPRAHVVAGAARAPPAPPSILLQISDITTRY